jgi:hypothetical protein
MRVIYKNYINDVYRFELEKLGELPLKTFRWGLKSFLDWEYGWIELGGKSFLSAWFQGEEISEEAALEKNRKAEQVGCSICKISLGSKYKGYKDLVDFYELPLCSDCYIKMRKVFDSGKKVCDVCRFAGEVMAASRKSKAGQRWAGIEYVCEKHYIDELEEKIEKINKKWWKKILFID